MYQKEVDPNMAPVDSSSTRQSEPRLWLSRTSVDARPQPDVPENYWADALSIIPSRYEVLSQVGTGGMGIVFKVRDRDTHEIVALKILKPGMASASAMQENLRKEVCLARKVTHKNVCRIHEFNRSNAAASISMEFVEGESLLSKLRRVGSLPLSESLEIARQICAGLREAHAQGIVHRDLKPANIMVDVSGTVKIMDFGIARLTEEDGQMTGTIAGTPAYMAPEQLELKTMGPQTDIYSLGLLLYEMVTGSQAFAGDTPIAIALKQIRELPRRPSEFIPALPAHSEAIILKCLRKDPAKRFQSVDELDAALESVTKVRVAVPGRVSVELRRARLAVQRDVQFGLEKIRAAISRLVTVAREARRVSLQVNRVAVHGVEKASAFLRAQDWRAATRSGTGQAVAVLLGSLVVFGLVADRRSQANEFAAARFAAPAVQALQSPNPKNAFSTVGAAPTGAPGSVSTDHVDLSRGSGVASAPLPDVTSSEIPASLGVSTTTKNKAKRQSGMHSSSSSAPLAKSAERQTRPSLTDSLKPPTQAPVGPAAPADRTDEQRTANTQQDLEAPVLPATSSNATPKLVEGAEEQETAQAVWYLEVGSFKEANWAQQAVEKLSALGYHAISVHQTRLWMQSFHVQVGPFKDPKELGDAQQSLAARGFKPHLVK